MTLAQLLIFLPAAVIVAASPGANNLLAFANGTRHGFLAAALALLGRCVAFALMIAMVIGGLGALLEASETAFQMIKWGGVLYLIYLGIQMMLSRPEPQKRGEVIARTSYALARREFLVAMTNPKAVLLFTAFVPQFIVPADEASFTVQLIALGTLYVAVEFVAAMGWAFAGSSIRTLRPTAKRLKTINRASGFMMLGAAGVLATTRRA